MNQRQFGCLNEDCGITDNKYTLSYALHKARESNLEGITVKKKGINPTKDGQLLGKFVEQWLEQQHYTYSIIDYNVVIHGIGSAENPHVFHGVYYSVFAESVDVTRIIIDATIGNM